MSTHVSLEEIASRPRKQPELWWGDECVSISKDGRRVIHFKRKTKPHLFSGFNPQDGAGSGFASGGSGGSGIVYEQRWDYSLPRQFGEMSMSEIFNYTIQKQREIDKFNKKNKKPRKWGTISTN